MRPIMLPPLNAVINFAPFQSVCRYRRGISLEIPAPELASEILAAGSALKSEERHLCGRFPQQGAKSPDVDFCTHSIHLASIAREIHLEVLHGKYRWQVLHRKFSGFHCSVGGEHLGIGEKIFARWEFHQQLPSSLPPHRCRITPHSAN